MSDTPRTDAVCDQGRAHFVYDHARKLERELNAAKERIKKLEEAGGLMLPFTKWLSNSKSAEDALNRWNELFNDSSPTS